MTAKKKGMLPNMAAEKLEGREQEVEAMAKQVLQRAVNGELDRGDLELWHREGHYLITWLRAQFEALHYI